MISEESGQSLQLDSYDRDINPRFGAGFGLFVIAHEATMAHQPAEGPLDDPAAGENFESAGAVATFDHFHREFGRNPQTH